MIIAEATNRIAAGMINITTRIHINSDLTFWK